MLRCLNRNTSQHWCRRPRPACVSVTCVSICSLDDFEKMSVGGAKGPKVNWVEGKLVSGGRGLLLSTVLKIIANYLASLEWGWLRSWWFEAWFKLMWTHLVRLSESRSGGVPRGVLSHWSLFSARISDVFPVFTPEWQADNRPFFFFCWNHIWSHDFLSDVMFEPSLLSTPGYFLTLWKVPTHQGCWLCDDALGFLSNGT